MLTKRIPVLGTRYIEYDEDLNLYECSVCGCIRIYALATDYQLCDYCNFKQHLGRSPISDSDDEVIIDDPTGTLTADA